MDEEKKQRRRAIQAEVLGGPERHAVYFDWGVVSLEDDVLGDWAVNLRLYGQARLSGLKESWAQIEEWNRRLHRKVVGPRSAGEPWELLELHDLQRDGTSWTELAEMLNRRMADGFERWVRFERLYAERWGIQLPPEARSAFGYVPELGDRDEFHNWLVSLPFAPGAVLFAGLFDAIRPLHVFNFTEVSIAEIFEAALAECRANRPAFPMGGPLAADRVRDKIRPFRRKYAAFLDRHDAVQIRRSAP